MSHPFAFFLAKGQESNKACASEQRAAACMANSERRPAWQMQSGCRTAGALTALGARGYNSLSAPAQGEPLYVPSE
jgi:hypothetical protein